MWSESLSADQRKELDNLLERPPNLQTTLMPGLPVPAWVDTEDLPPETLILVDD